MPSNQKRRVRARQQKTGESYQAAVQAMRGPEGLPDDGFRLVREVLPAGVVPNLSREDDDLMLVIGPDDKAYPIATMKIVTLPWLKGLSDADTDTYIRNLRLSGCHRVVIFNAGDAVSIAGYRRDPYVTALLDGRVFTGSKEDAAAFHEVMRHAAADPDYKIVTNYSKGTLPISPVLGLFDIQPDEVAVKLARKTPSGACLGVAPFCPYMLYDIFGRDDRLAVRVWVGRSIAQDLLLWNASPLDWVSHLEERRKGHIADLSGGIQVWQLPAKRLDPNSIVVVYDGEGEDDLKSDWTPPADRVFHIQRP